MFLLVETYPVVFEVLLDLESVVPLIGFAGEGVAGLVVVELAVFVVALAGFTVEAVAGLVVVALAVFVVALVGFEGEVEAIFVVVEIAVFSFVFVGFTVAVVTSFLGVNELGLFDDETLGFCVLIGLTVDVLGLIFEVFSFLTSSTFATFIFFTSSYSFFFVCICLKLC